MDTAFWIPTARMFGNLATKLLSTSQRQMETLPYARGDGSRRAQGNQNAGDMEAILGGPPPSGAARGRHARRNSAETLETVRYVKASTRPVRDELG